MKTLEHLPSEEQIPTIHSTEHLRTDKSLPAVRTLPLPAASRGCIFPGWGPRI
jgi:hypothetical protein